jgi:hypothetical protein
MTSDDTDAASGREPVPERPRDAGVPEDAPEELGQLEGARILANDARHHLRADGFTDVEIDEWAEAYMAEGNVGEAEDLIAWIRAKEQPRGG